MSWTALVLLLAAWTFALVSLFLAVAKQITWLDYLYYFSYIKLAVTLIKYVPQVSNTHARTHLKNEKQQIVYLFLFFCPQNDLKKTIEYSKTAEQQRLHTHILTADPL